MLLVQDSADLSRIWARFFILQGIDCVVANSRQEAIEALDRQSFDVLVLDPVLRAGGGITVADFATFRNPEIAIIAVTSSSFFSDGSVFEIIPNARGLMRVPLRPDDLVAFVEHCAPKSVANSAALKRAAAS